MSLGGMILTGFGASGGGGTELATPALAVVDNGDGTVTATVSGSTSGSTNTLYYQTQTGAFGGGTWTAAAGRSGDGTIAATVPPGFYWWYVGSAIAPDLTVSNMVYQNVASQTDPVHLQCLSAVQAVVQSLSLAGVAASSVVIKKLAADRILGSLKAGTLGVPLPAVVLVAETERQDAALGNNALDDIVYPVRAILVLVDNQEPTLAAGLPTVLEWRQKLNRAFRQQRLAGAATIIDTVVEPDAIADPQGWAAGFYVSAISFRFTSREPRGKG
jgi:hypothetical protein